MRHRIKTADDLAWLLDHTRAFQGGQVTDLHVKKHRLFDENSGREVSAGTTITASIRYEVAGRGETGPYALTRFARLTMLGATDFSIFEQDGRDCSHIGAIQAEASAGRLRFWFDLHGEVYVVCDEALIEEASRPGASRPIRAGMSEWSFQARRGPLPTADWVLEHLDRAGLPCAWRTAKRTPGAHPTQRWAGELRPAMRLPFPDEDEGARACVSVRAFGPLDGYAFVISLRAPQPHEGGTSRLFLALADLVAQHFEGLCVTGDQIMEGDEWLGARQAAAELEREGEELGRDRG